jgi:hypothetical protein
MKRILAAGGDSSEQRWRSAFSIFASVQNCTDSSAPEKYCKLSRISFSQGVVVDTNQRQIAVSVLECLRGDLVYAHLNNGSRVMDVADLRQYLYEQMDRIRTHAMTMDDLYGYNQARGAAETRERA